MLLDLLQYYSVRCGVSSLLPLLLQQGLLNQVLFGEDFIVVLDVTEAPSSLLLSDVAKVDNFPLVGATLLTMHGSGTYPAPFGTLCN